MGNRCDGKRATAPGEANSDRKRCRPTCSPIMIQTLSPNTPGLKNHIENLRSTGVLKHPRPTMDKRIHTSPPDYRRVMKHRPEGIPLRIIPLIGLFSIRPRPNFEGAVVARGAGVFGAGSEILRVSRAQGVVVPRWRAVGQRPRDANFDLGLRRRNTPHDRNDGAYQARKNPVFLNRLRPFVP